MTNSHKTTTYHGLALLLGAASLVAVACSDDEDAIEQDGGAGNGGTTTAGTTSGGKPGKAGSSAGGNANGGTAGGGAGGRTTAGGGAGGDLGIAGDGGGGEDVGGAGAGQGGADPAHGGAGGDAAGGGGDEGGVGGAGSDVVPDTLDNGTFTEYDAGWSESGDVAASTTKWIYGEEPGLNHWAATAYQVSTFQTVSPLPNGTYSFSMEVNRAASLNDQYLFAQGCGAGEPSVQVKQSTAAAGDAGYTKITLSGIVVSSGSCTVGIYTDAPADGWANIDNALFVKE